MYLNEESPCSKDKLTSLFCAVVVSVAVMLHPQLLARSELKEASLTEDCKLDQIPDCQQIQHTRQNEVRCL